MSTPLPTPLPLPHPECTSAQHDWIRKLEQDAAWAECENRPWANEWNRAATGCIGKDFVLHNPRVHLRFFWNAAEKSLAGVVHWSGEAEGPPKGAHGASIALVFDEILAYPVWRTGLTAFTANLNLNLRRMVPHLSTLRFHARIREKNGRKIVTEGAITSPDESIIYADCVGLWVENTYLSKLGDTLPTAEMQVATSKL